MKLQYKILIIVVLMAASFAVGRRSVPAPSIGVATKSHDTTNSDTHKVTTIEKDPSGKETTTITEDTVTHTQADSSSKESISPIKQSKINISALVGTDIHDLKPMYGISASKEFIGPITLGAWGLTNGTAGISVGLDF